MQKEVQLRSTSWSGGCNCAILVGLLAGRPDWSVYTLVPLPPSLPLNLKSKYELLYFPPHASNYTPPTFCAFNTKPTVCTYKWRYKWNLQIIIATTTTETQSFLTYIKRLLSVNQKKVTEG